MTSMTQKTTKAIKTLSVLFVVIVAVVLCVVLIGCNNADNHDGDEKYLPEITGITVIRNRYEYDGQAHGIKISGTLDGDKIYYSYDGVNWQDGEIFKSDPGEYTIYYKIVRAGYAEYVHSETLVITRTGVTGVFAYDIICVCGKPIVPDISGLQDDDTVKYSIGEGEYSEQIDVLDVGVYTVKYVITRPNVGTSEGTFKLTILPDISGTYIGNGERIILTDTKIILNNGEYSISYGTDGSGQAEVNGDIVDFSVNGGVLQINNKEYIRLGEASHIVELRINNVIYYASAEDTARAEITFAGEFATVKVSGIVVAEISGYNYCENILGGEEIFRDYSVGSVEFSVPSNFADITLILLNDAAIEPIADCIVLCDDAPHSLEIAYENVLYLNDGVYEEFPRSYTEVGEYSYTVVIFRDGYLPCVVESKLIILPDVGGVYVADGVGVLEINGFTAKINNNSVAFEHGLSGGLIAGEQAEYGSGTITIGGVEYVRTEEKIMAFVIGDILKVLGCNKSYEVHITELETKTLVSILEEGTDNECYAVDIEGKIVSVILDGNELNGEDGIYYISEFEPNSRVVWVVFEID